MAHGPLVFSMLDIFKLRNGVLNIRYLVTSLRYMPI